MPDNAGLRSVSRLAALARVWPRVAKAYLRRSVRTGYLPTNVWLEPTNFCNLDCTLCPSARIPGRSRGFLDIDLARKVLAELEPVRPVVCLHMGGEPLLHPRLGELVRIVRVYGGSPNLYTNAVTLDADATAMLLDARPDWLGFSVDGHDAATYEAVRRRGRFDAVMTNVRGFLAERRRRGQRLPYAHLSMLRLPGAADEGARRRFRDELLALGLDRFDEVEPHGWAGLYPSNIRARGGHAVCPSPWTSVVVLWDGIVVPCCLDMLRRNPVGDARTQTLREIFDGPAMQDLRAKLAAGRHEEVELCRGCEVPRGGSTLGISHKVFAEAGDLVRPFLPRWRR